MCLSSKNNGVLFFQFKNTGDSVMRVFCNMASVNLDVRKMAESSASYIKDECV